MPIDAGAGESSAGFAKLRMKITQTIHCVSWQQSKITGGNGVNHRRREASAREENIVKQFATIVPPGEFASKRCGLETHRYRFRIHGSLDRAHLSPLEPGSCHRSRMNSADPRSNV